VAAAAWSWATSSVAADMDGHGNPWHGWLGWLGNVMGGR
jgi:hypothetical protein